MNNSLSRSISGFRLHSVLVAALMFGVGGCRTVEPVALPIDSIGITYTVISDSLSGDPSVDSMIEPYRVEMESEMSRIVGSSSVRLTPGGGLGDLVTDAMLHTANIIWPNEADFAITNSGGLRNSLPEGAITLGMIFEVMPFDNALVLVTYTGEQVIELANSMAQNSPQPVSGITFTIRGSSAEDVFVQGRPVDPLEYYQAVSIDYLVDGGGWMEALWDPIARNNSGYFLRDAIVDYVQSITDAGAAIEQGEEPRIRIDSQ